MARAAEYVFLRSRPSGVPGEESFGLARAPLPPPGAGEVVVENRYLSVDPYMRGRMDDAPSYYPPWPLEEPLDGDAIGVVVESRLPQLPAGTWVHSEYGLRDAFVAAAADLRVLAAPPAGCDHGCFLDLLGGTGLTAYLGVVDVLAPQPGETVFVSSAAGSVGSIAGQLCRVAGARTIGSTGSAEKVRIAVERYRFDAAFDYREEPASAALARLAPAGIDGFFDNVGGEQLEAAIEALRVGGRIAKCGAIAGYNGEPPPGPRNLHHFFGKRLTMTGFLVSDHRERRPEFEARMRAWIESGEIRADRRSFAGLEQAGAAFRDLFSGGNVGKTVIELGPGGDG